MEKLLYLWQGKQIVQESTERECFRERFLTQLLFFDEPALFLAVQTSGKVQDSSGKVAEEFNFTFQDLIEIAKKYPSPFPFLMSEEIAKKNVIRALDTLLDSAIYRAEWRLLNNKWKRVFLNRNELFHVFAELREDLLKNSLEPEKKSEVIYKTRKYIYLREPLDENSKLYYDERIKKVEKELKEFIDKKLVPKLSCEKDVVLVPVMRKGMILIEQLKKDTGLKNCNICSPIYLELKQLNNKELNNKEIVLFDDAIQEGKTVERYLNKLKNLQINLDNVKVVTYLLNKDACNKSTLYEESIKPRLLIEPGKTCSDWEFHREVSDILMYITHLGIITDPDHLVVNAKFVKRQEPSRVMELFESLGIGEVFEPDLDYLHPTRKKITLNLTEQEYHKLTGKELPEHVEGIDICKIRFIFELDQDDHKAQIHNIVPIVLPVVNNISDEQQDQVIQKYGFSLECKKEDYDGIPCYLDAIIYHMTTSLLKGFFREFSKTSKERNMQLKKGSISSTWEYLTTKHPAWASILQKFSHELEQYLQ